MWKLVTAMLLAMGLTLSGISSFAGNDNPTGSDTMRDAGLKDKSSLSESAGVEAAEPAPDQNSHQPRMESSEQKKTEIQPDGRVEYVVKEGDTLASIAERTLGSEDKWIVIARANDLSDPDTIFVGQKLVIPSGGEDEDSGSGK